jgi:hypothetical protein
MEGRAFGAKLDRNWSLAVKTQLSFIEESVHEALAIDFYDGGVMKTPSPFADHMCTA